MKKAAKGPAAAAERAARTAAREESISNAATLEMERTAKYEKLRRLESLYTKFFTTEKGPEEEFSPLVDEEIPGAPFVDQAHVVQSS